ncbi:MAG: TonB-dependent receptor domain-containing protein, partial [Spongiibacteraceae bacterium]
CYYGRTPDNALGQCDLSGETMPFAPKLTGNIALTWEQPIASGDMYARLDYRYSGSANSSSELDPRHKEDAYGVGNFRLGFRNAKYDVAGWVKNLADETYFVQKSPANVATVVDTTVGSPEGSYQAYVGEPRTAGVTMRMFF